MKRVHACAALLLAACTGFKDRCSGDGECLNGRVCQDGHCVPGYVATSSSSSSGGPVDAGPVVHPWALWRVPNPGDAGFPNPASYTINDADDTVLDNVTGLRWQRHVSTTSMTWDEAALHCAAPWRVPSRMELASLVDPTRPGSAAAIDADAFPATPLHTCWSASGYALTPANVWTLDLSSGHFGQQFKGAQFYVRCVQ